MQKWEKAFCPFSRSEKRNIRFDKFKWHVFSSGLYESSCENQAIEDLKSHYSSEYYVIPEFSIWRNEVAFILNALPESKLIGLKKDFYIFPKNLAWTVAFTHEDDYCGPYFAKHKDYLELNKKNLKCKNKRF